MSDGSTDWGLEFAGAARRRRAQDRVFSFVATSRNDDHGGDVLRRTQSFISFLALQCERHRVKGELVLVDWNPPQGRPPLADVLGWPAGSEWFTARVVTVPRDLHLSLANGRSLSMFQMIAKNVGIRRAAGDFVIATNIDIIFSDELFEWLATAQLDENTLYRSDRWDIPNEIQLEPDFDRLLRRARDEAIRRNLADGTETRQDGQWSSDGLTRIDRYVLGSVQAVLEHSLGLAEQGELPKRELRELLEHIIPRSRRLYHTPRAHLNGCGDFTMLSRSGWERLRGYPEWPIFSWNIDSVSLIHAAYEGFAHQVLPGDAVHYHIEHDYGSGYTPGGMGALLRRLEQRGTPLLDWEAYQELLVRLSLDSEAHKKIVFNPESWGFAEHELPDRTLSGPDAPALQPRARNFGKLNERFAADGLKSLVLEPWEASIEHLEMSWGGHGPTLRLRSAGVTVSSTAVWTIPASILAEGSTIWLRLDLRVASGNPLLRVEDAAGGLVRELRAFDPADGVREIILAVDSAAAPARLVLAPADDGALDVEASAVDVFWSSASPEGALNRGSVFGWIDSGEAADRAASATSPASGEQPSQQPVRLQPESIAAAKASLVRPQITRGTGLAENGYYGEDGEKLAFDNVFAFAAHASWGELDDLAPGQPGYQSWLAPFKHIAEFGDAAPRPALQQLIHSVAAMNIATARVTVEQLTELEGTMRDVTREEVLATASGDSWLQNYLLNVWEYVHGVTDLESRPWNVTLPVADLCNARCTFCTSWIEGRALVKLDQVRAFGEAIANAQQIGLIGHGEPLAHPQFDKICEIIAENMDPRAFIYTITNGVHLKKWSEHLERIHLESISISLNAASAETHDVVMGLGPDAFDEVLSAIRNILAQNSPALHRNVYITMVVTQQNMHEVAQFVRLGNDLGVTGIWLRALLPQSSLVAGLNYHTLAPNLHPDFKRLKAEALAAIAASKVPVQAEPQMWDTDILAGPLKAEVERNPPPFITREEALRNRDLRHRVHRIYEMKASSLRGRKVDASAYSSVRRYGDGVHVGTPAAQWSYALSVPVEQPGDLSATGGVVRLRASEVSGAPGLGLLDRATNTWVDRKPISSDGDVELHFPAGAGPLDLVMENQAEGGTSSAALLSQGAVTIGEGNQSWTGRLELAQAIVHNALDPLDDGDNPFNRGPRFACKAVYYNLYLNEMFFRIVPCCYMTIVPGFEEIRFDGSVPFMEAWNSPAMVELRRRLKEGPLFGACKKCAEKW